MREAVKAATGLTGPWGQGGHGDKGRVAVGINVFGGRSWESRGSYFLIASLLVWYLQWAMRLIC